MAKWLITFENGYCGCNKEEIIDGTYEEAQDWAEESLMDYAETWTHIAFGWNEEFTEEEFDRTRSKKNSSSSPVPQPRSSTEAPDPFGSRSAVKG